MRKNLKADIQYIFSTVPFKGDFQIKKKKLLQNSSFGKVN